MSLAQGAPAHASGIVSLRGAVLSVDCSVFKMTVDIAQIACRVNLYDTRAHECCRMRLETRGGGCELCRINMSTAQAAWGHPCRRGDVFAQRTTPLEPSEKQTDASLLASVLPAAS